MGSVQQRANRILEASAGARLLARAWARLRAQVHAHLHASPGVYLCARLHVRAPVVAMLALSAALAACTTPQERAVRNQAEVEQMMVVYGPACERLGYAPNTDAWRSCVLQLNARDDLQRYQTSPGYYGGGAGYWRGGWWRPIW